MYSTHNEGKYVVAERFIRILKNKTYKCWKIHENLKKKIYKYMTSVSKDEYIDKLDEIRNKYNNIYHSTIKNEASWIKFKHIYWL